MPGTDLPPGEWSALLVGDFWPGPDSLAVLTAAAAGRHRTEVQCEAYADHLRAIRHAQLAGQDGLAADTARSLFARGEDRVRATAERNGAKWQAYESARHQVAALRDDLRQLAVDGNSAIRRIQESAAPMPAKVGGIVDVIAETQTLARTKAADSAGNILTDVQRVLDTQDSGLSARTFAATHGINPGLPHPPAAESLTQHVTAVLESPAPAAGESRTGTEACGSAGGSASSGGECGAGSARPLRAGSTAEVSDSVAALRAAASAAATAVAAGGSIGATLTDGADATAARPAPPAGTPPATIVGGSPAPSPAPTAPGRSGPHLITPGRPAAGPGPVPPQAVNHQSATAPGRARPGVGPIPPTTATTTSGAAVVRRTAPAAPAERAFADAPGPNETNRLAPVLAVVARQEPRLRWAVGSRSNGDLVLTTDLAGGWIPPGVVIPAGIRLLDPALRSGEPADLLSDCTTVATYAPGQYVSPDMEIPTTSIDARAVPEAHDLGWELLQATTWRDGLPRLAHTLARAATAGTGWLESEVALLHDNMTATADRVLDAYPATIATKPVGDWQLLATIAALLDEDRAGAAYHFAWFTVAQFAMARFEEGAQPPGCVR